MKNNALRWILGILLIAGIALTFAYRDRLDTVALQQWIQDAGLAAPLLFIAIYAVGTVIFLPGSMLTLAGGALFGPVLGTFYNLTGATIGALLAFLLTRYLASDWLAYKTGGRLKQLKDGVEGEGWRFVAFVRLVPLFPFNLLNYALGLTRIRLVHYLLATCVCMLPGAIAYTYLGYAGREAMAEGEGLIQKGLLALAALAVVAFLPHLIGRLRRGSNLTVEQLKRSLDAENDLLLLDVRSAEDYVGEQGHIGGSRNIPLEELEKCLDELEHWLEKPIAVVCRTDRCSTKASRILSENGFADVHVITGGMTAWNRNGWPVE